MSKFVDLVMPGLRYHYGGKMALPPSFCYKCLINHWNFKSNGPSCPLCGKLEKETMPNPIFFDRLRKKPDYGRRTLLNNEYQKIIHRPFMIGGVEPNDKYRPWLEQNIGRQTQEWDWDLAPNNSQSLMIVFKHSQDAVLFELTWP